MSKENIEQLIIKLKFVGDVSGELPIYNFNYNYLNKNSNVNGNIYIPNKIFLKSIISQNKLNNIDNLKKLQKLLISKDEILKLYNDFPDKIESKDLNNIIKENIDFVIKVFFKVNNNFYLQGRKFIIKSVTNNTILNNGIGELLKKNNQLYSNLCSDNHKIKNKCNINNIEEGLLFKLKENEKKYLVKFNKNLSTDDLNNQAFKLAIEKFRKGNIDEQIKNYADEVIKNANKKNDYIKAGIKYNFYSKSGIQLNLKNDIRKDIILTINLQNFINIKDTKKIYIEHGNCKTKKKYLKTIWDKLTKKNKSNNIKTKIKKWKYVNRSNGYELLPV